MLFQVRQQSTHVCEESSMHEQTTAPKEQHRTMLEAQWIHEQQACTAEHAYREHIVQWCEQYCPLAFAWAVLQSACCSTKEVKAWGPPPDDYVVEDVLRERLH